MTKKKTTIYDLAEHLGLSPSTVSRAINLHPRISEKTILEVRRAMEELDYHPEMPHCRQGHQKKAFAFGRKPCRILVLWHSSQAVASLDCAKILRNTDWGDHAVIQTGYFSDADKLLSDADAVLLASDPDSEWLRRRLRSKVVVQVRGRRNPGKEQFWDHITYHNETVGVLAAEYLIGHGARHVAIMIPSNNVAQQRLFHFRKVCEAHKVKLTVFKQPFYSLNASTMAYHVRELIRKDPPVQGLFVFNTMGAAALSRILLQHGIRPEQDLRVISTDSLQELQQNMEVQQVQSAVISVRTEEMFQSAFNQLLWRMRNPIAPVQTIMLEPVLLPGSVL